MGIYRAYVISFERPIEDKFDYAEFHKKLTTAKGIEDWWHYLTNTYIVITPTSILASGVYSYLEKIAPNKVFLICELNLSNYHGLLNPKAWDWIDKYASSTK